MTVIRFLPEDLELFALASHDNNPLHTSADYARKTAFGEPVVFGILGAIAALGCSRPRPTDCLESASLTFRGPLFCGVDYDVKLIEKNANKLKLSVEDAGRVRLTGTFSFRPANVAKSTLWYSPTDPQITPARRSANDLTTDLKFNGQYGPAEGAFQKLIERWDLANYGATYGQLSTLLWSSYLVGMHLPGERAVFSQLTLNFEPTEADDRLPLTYAPRVKEFDERYDLLNVEADLSRGSVRYATAEISSFVRHDSPRLSLTSLHEHLPTSTRLSGKTALVVGGSRGLGASLVAGLVSQGCHVLVNYRSSVTEVMALQSALDGEPGRVTLLQGDAGDPAWCQDVANDRHNKDQALDLLICCASPPIRNIGLAATSVDRIVDYVRDSLKLVCSPLAAFHEALERSSGTVVVISSTVASTESTDTPPDWNHYVSAKFAIEGLTRSVAQQSTATKFLIVRPPRLLTDQTNSTNGRTGALPCEGVAAKIVQQVCDPQELRLQVLDLSQTA